MHACACADANASMCGAGLAENKTLAEIARQKHVDVSAALLLILINMIVLMRLPTAH